MSSINNLCWEPVSKSEQVVPLSLEYTQDGQRKRWDLYRGCDTVCVLIFDSKKNCFVFPQQFRPAVYLNHVHERDSTVSSGNVDPLKFPAELGISIELPMKSVKPAETLEEIVRLAAEECGYRVTMDKLLKVTGYRGVGNCGQRQLLYYAEVNENELSATNLKPEVAIRYVPIEEAYKMVFDDNVNKESIFCFAILWFINYKSIRIPV